jgi:hypothetical protein
MTVATGSSATVQAVAASMAQARIRAGKLYAAVQAKTSIEVGKGRIVTIDSIEALPKNDAVKLTITLTQDGKDVTPKGFNPWIIANPPTLVDDPNGDVVIESTNEAGDITKRTLRDDPQAALADIIKRIFAR